MVVVLDHLQNIQPHHQRAGNSDDEQGAGHQSFVDQARLFLVVLDWYRFGHFCSGSLTVEEVPISGLEVSPLKK